MNNIGADQPVHLHTVKRPLSKRPNIGFQDQLSPNAGQKYCRMLQEHSAILFTVIKLPLSLRSLFCLYFSGCFTQVLLYSKTCVKRPLSKRQKRGFQEQLLLSAGQKYCRMLQGEHSAIPLTVIKLPFVIKIFVLSIFEWPFYTGFTVQSNLPKRASFWKAKLSIIHKGLSYQDSDFRGLLNKKNMYIQCLMGISVVS